MQFVLLVLLVMLACAASPRQCTVGREASVMPLVLELGSVLLSLGTRGRKQQLTPLTRSP